MCSQVSFSNLSLDHPVLWPKIGPARQVSSCSSDDETIGLAKKWLDNCLSSHSKCERIDTPLLPTRVISVGENNEDVNLYISEQGDSAEYAALSHCWGISQPLTLTKATLEDMKQKVVFNDSSKTFREAVDATRRLGIPFLWIDSLCILQDDRSDWEKEAPTMSDVYNSSTVTLSAASSNSAAGGLFPLTNERKEKHKEWKLPCTAPDGSPEYVYVRARTKDVFNIQNIVHSSVEPEKPWLSSRGWVLQEDHLSPRMLHFRKEELAWTCNSCSRCECRIRPSLLKSNPFRIALGALETTEERTRELNRYWPAIAMEYSRRNLTIPGDRIAALSGLAKYMEEETTDTYVCGLWYEDMADQLLWYIDRSGGQKLPAARFAHPYAPTWSWMSVPAPISYWDRYPTGSVPRHDAIVSDDAVDSYLRVCSIERVPIDAGNEVGRLARGAVLLYAYALPVSFDINTKQWITTEYHLHDLMPSMVREYIDVEEDLPEKNPNESYAFIFAGRWVGQGITLSCLQVVCILARRVSANALEYIKSAEDIQEETLEVMNNRSDQWSEFRPDLNNSFYRVGLVRNIGSIDAWEKSKVPFKPTFLY